MPKTDIIEYVRQFLNTLSFGTLEQHEVNLVIEKHKALDRETKRNCEWMGNYKDNYDDQDDFTQNENALWLIDKHDYTPYGVCNVQVPIKKKNPAYVIPVFGEPAYAFYVFTRCTFVRTPVFPNPKDPQNKAKYTSGKFTSGRILWACILRYCYNYLIDELKQALDTRFVVYNHANKEAVGYHLKMGMRPAAFYLSQNALRIHDIKRLKNVVTVELDEETEHDNQFLQGYMFYLSRPLSEVNYSIVGSAIKSVLQNERQFYAENWTTFEALDKDTNQMTTYWKYDNHHHPPPGKRTNSMMDDRDDHPPPPTSKRQRRNYGGRSRRGGRRCRPRRRPSRTRKTRRCRCKQ
jgi:hypothetical protein